MNTKKLLLCGGIIGTLLLTSTVAAHQAQHPTQRDKLTKIVEKRMNLKPRNARFLVDSFFDVSVAKIKSNRSKKVCYAFTAHGKKAKVKCIRKRRVKSGGFIVSRYRVKGDSGIVSRKAFMDALSSHGMARSNTVDSFFDVFFDVTPVERTKKRKRRR